MQIVSDQFRARISRYGLRVQVADRLGWFKEVDYGRRVLCDYCCDGWLGQNAPESKAVRSLGPSLQGRALQRSRPVTQPRGTHSGGIGLGNNGHVAFPSYHPALDQCQSDARSTKPRRTGFMCM